MICPVCNASFDSTWPHGRPIWTTCYQCKHRGNKTFCNKCTRNSFAPSGEGKGDQWESIFADETESKKM